MGLEDRQYYRDDQYQGSFGGFSWGGRSVVTNLIIINVIIYALDTFFPKVEGIAGDNVHQLSYWLGIGSDRLYYVWTFLTYGFAHSSYPDIWHILGNMFVLFFLGRPVEYRLGRQEFLKFYLVSIVVAGVGFTVFRLLIGADNWFIVGASGAVSAVVALFIFMYPKQTILLMGIIPMPAWLLGVLLLLSNFFSALSPESHIAWEAHLIGAGFGVAYYLRRWDFSRLQFGNPGKWFRSRPKLRVHDPDSGAHKLKAQADAILQKISEQGEESLTSRERKTLNKYSAQLRKNRQP
jgi:membrane associated rhomboid family serine protease